MAKSNFEKQRQLLAGFVIRRSGNWRISKETNAQADV